MLTLSWRFNADLFALPAGPKKTTKKSSPVPLFFFCRLNKKRKTVPPSIVRSIEPRVICVWHGATIGLTPPSLVFFSRCIIEECWRSFDWAGKFGKENREGRAWKRGVVLCARRDGFLAPAWIWLKVLTGCTGPLAHHWPHQIKKSHPLKTFHEHKTHSHLRIVIIWI